MAQCVRQGGRVGGGFKGLRVDQDGRSTKCRRNWGGRKEMSFRRAAGLERHVEGIGFQIHLMIFKQGGDRLTSAF